MIILIISFICLCIYIILLQNNILFSDVKIRTKKYKTKNIFNHTIECLERYYIYKSWCYGLIRKPLKFIITDGWEISHHIDVYYSDCYSKFDNKRECEQLINDIKENPNKYILIG